MGISQKIEPSSHPTKRTMEMLNVLGELVVLEQLFRTGDRQLAGKGTVRWPHRAPWQNPS